MISPQTIARILDAAHVEEVVGEYVNLKKRGANAIGLCPFHNEKTPSFVVSPSKGIYKCFGCGVAGNSVKFIMEHEHLSYPESLRLLAEKYNIEVEETERTDEQKQIESEKESLIIVNTFAQKHFTSNLFETAEGKSVALTYFRERGFSDKIIEQFQLGYSMDQPDDLTNAALKKGYQLDLLKKAGLASSREGSKRDFFWGRVMFPIHNISGRPIAFAGRTLKKSTKSPKYINTPESEVYHKSDILYGIHFAKNELRKKEECYLVEGYTDVISLFQAGIENVVASSGTSLTPGQVRLIKRYANQITVLYDGDAAGIKAALRGTDIILEQGLNVKVLLLPDGHDPDSFVRETGAAQFKSYVDENKKDFILFKADLARKESLNDPVKKVALIKDIVESIAMIPDPIKRSVYIKECSTLLDMEESILVRETNMVRSRLFKQKENKAERSTRLEQREEAIISEEESRVIDEHAYADMLERDLIRLMMDFGNLQLDDDATVAKFILEELQEITIHKKTYARAIKLIQIGMDRDQFYPPEFFINHPEDEISSLAIELLTSRYEVSENWENRFEILIPDIRENFKKDIQSSLTRFKLYKVRKMIEANTSRLKEEKDEQIILRLQKTHIHLHEMKQELSEVLGTVVFK